MYTDWSNGNQTTNVYDMYITYVNVIITTHSEINGYIIYYPHSTTFTITYHTLVNDGGWVINMAD